MYYIYKITNLITKKHYIGFTSNPKIRWQSHKHNKAKRPLYESIQKYGIENFTFEVIFQHEDRNYTLLEKEPLYIKLFEGYTKGYNLTKGGEDTNSLKARQENSKRMKEKNPMKVLRTNKGSFQKGYTYIMSNDHKNKIRNTKYGALNPNYKKANTSNHLNTKTFTCEICNIVTNKGNYTRWHGINCKHNIYS